MTVVTIRDAGRSYQVNDPGGHIGEPIAAGRPYEYKMLSEIRRLDLQGSALDVGAHVGNHALYLAAICGLKVWAFEPHPETCDRLVENLDLNPHLPVEAFEMALGAETAHAEWRPDQKMALDSGRKEGGVPVFRFDDLECPDDLTLVKVDVEGMEPDVLDGMTEAIRTHSPLIYTEAHTREAVEAQRAVLSPLRYSLTHFIQMGSRMACWVPR